MDKITVVIPITPNMENLDKSIYSILNQNFQNYEILLVLNKNIDFPIKNTKIRTVHEKAKNIPELLNKSIKHINTEYVTFLNPNDMLLFDALKLRITELSKNTELIGCYGLFLDLNLDYSVKKNDNYDYFFHELNPPENNYKNLLSGELTLTTSCLLIKKEILEEIQFNPELNLTYEWEFFLKLFKKHSENISRIKDPICISMDKEILYKKIFL